MGIRVCCEKVQFCLGARHFLHLSLGDGGESRREKLHTCCLHFEVGDRILISKLAVLLRRTAVFYVWVGGQEESIPANLSCFPFCIFEWRLGSVAKEYSFA